MKRQHLALFALTLLSACGNLPGQRQPEVRSTPAPVIESTATPPVRAKPQTAPATQPAPAIRQSGGGYLEGDGPGDAPADLDSIPDAKPRPEPLHRYANRPYTVLGKTYTPRTEPGNYKVRGIASWYGKKFHGKKTSSGEPYDMYAMNVAHPTLPIPSYVRVTNLANKKSVVVRINDRGPFMHGRVIDLSYTAAHKLDIIGNGSGEVEVESIIPDAEPSSTYAEPVKSEPLPPAESVAEAAPAPAPVAAAASTPDAVGNVYLQLGAFKSPEAAESFIARMRAELGDAASQLNLFVKDGLTRVHLGPYGSADEARSSAEGLKGKLGFKPLLNVR